MKRIEQVKFINDLVNSIKRDLVADVPRIPAEWDGHELRQWIIDRFTERAALGSLMRGARRREYQNDVITHNL